MKFFFICLFSLAFFIKVNGQDLLQSRQTSYYTFIYKLNNSEAKNIYKRDLWKVDKSYFHALVDSILTDSSYNKPLPNGHYLKAYTENNKLRFSITSIQNFDVKIINNNTDLRIQVYDSAGNIIDKAAVKVKHKKLRFDKTTLTYRDKKSNRKGLLRVTYKGFTAYYNLEREYNNSQFKRSSQKVLYSFPIKYAWLPVRYVIFLPVDGVKSIIHGYTSGTIGRTKYFFEKSYRKIACLFDDYYCDDVRYKFSRKHKGYLVFNKPIYLPNDTVRFKAFIVNKRGKPINKNVDVIVGNYRKRTKIASLTPYRKGAYHYQFYLHDSLGLKLDDNYELSLQLNDRKEYISEYFKYEDYELSKIKLELRTDQEFQCRGSDYIFYVKGTNENDLNLLDARVEILIKPVDYYQFYNDRVFISDTLYFEQKDLDPRKETVFSIPDSIFPQADFSYEALVQLSTSDNELITEKKSVSYFYHKQEIVHELEKDSLRLSFNINGKEKSQAVEIFGMDNFGNKTPIPADSLPVKIKVNPYFSDYLVRTDSLEEKISISNESALLNCLSERSKDSIRIAIQNPRNIPFSYFIYEKNREKLSGYGRSLNYHRKTTSASNYFVSIQYLWAGKIIDENYKITYQDQVLDINVSEPAIVYPGQETEIEIKVNDQEGNPVSDVDLTAYAYTKKFNAPAPEVPDLGKFKRNKTVINNFHFGDHYFGAHSGLQLNYKKWNIKAGLDSIAKYQFLYPGNKIYQFFYTPEDSITQFSPFVVNKGDKQTIHVVYVDNKPTYFSWSDNPQPYSFKIDSGFHQIKLRTLRKTITIDSLYFPFQKKLIFSLNDKLIHKHVNINEAEIELSHAEKRSLYNYIFPYRHTFGEQFAYITYRDRIQLLSSINNYKSNFLAGPVSGGISFQIVDGYSSWFKHESFFEYEFANRLLKMRSIDPEKRYPKFLTQWSPKQRLDDLVWTEEKIKEKWTQKIEQERYSKAKYANPTYTPPGAGTLLIDYQQKAGSHEKPLNILIFRYDDYDFTRVYPGTTNTMHNLEEGWLKLIYFYPEYKYHVYDSIQISPNGLNYQRISASSTLTKDDFSITVNKIIEEKIFNPASFDTEKHGQELRRINNAYQNQYRFTGNGNIIEGYIFEDGTNDPLPGVNVVAKGTAYGTISDMDGHYSLKVPFNVTTLVFSFIGFVTHEVDLNADNYENITLTPDVTALEEVVVTALGIARSTKSLGYAISTVNSPGFSGLPDSISTILAGKVAGVQISSSPGAGTSIEVRGAGTTQFSGTPLYVIDGIVFMGDIADLKPEFIDQINILKGESATAIYGSRAANGVVIITTKENTFKATGKKIVTGLETGSMSLNYDANANSIRNNFSDYAYWQPGLKTNADGIARFKVTFPDDVTSWKTFVLAMNDKRQSGKAEGMIKSFKPLMAQLAMPRFLVDGDSVAAIGKVLNYTPDTLRLSTSLEINDQTAFTKDISCANAHIDTLSIETQGSDSLHVKYYLKKSDGYFDGEQRSIPIIPLGMEETNGVFYALNRDTTFQISFSENLGEVTLFAQSDMLDVLKSEIQHVTNYKYACNEQLASKLKSLLYEKLIHEYQGEEYHHNQKINQLIAKIYKNRSSDGLWGWWANSPTNYWISLHVIEAMTLAKELGYKIKIDEGEIFDYLFWKLESEPDHREYIRILKMLRLINAKIDYASYIKTIQGSKLRGFSDLLNLMELKQYCGLPVNIDTLNHFSHETMMGNLYFSDSAAMENLPGNDISHTLLAYSILKNDSIPNTNKLSKIRNYFLENRNHGFWRNTYESANIIEAILPDILDGKKEAEKSSISISGALDKNIEAFPYQTTLKSTDEIQITKRGDFPVYLTAYQSNWNDNPLEHTDDFEINTRFDTADSSMVLEAGKEVKLIVDLKVKKDAEYVMIEIPVPAACSYTSKDTNYRIEAHREYFKEHTSIFCESLIKGSYRFEINLLPRYTGKYKLNPAKAELMYFPTKYGNNRLKTVEVH